MECPICGSELKLKYEHCCQFGVEESLYECPDCKMYAEEFAYGNIQINIGSFMTGYHHTASGEEREFIYKQIEALAKILKIQIKSGSII